MKHRSLLLLLLPLVAVVASAQSNAILDSFLQQKQALAAETSYMVAVGGAYLTDTATPEEALAMALANGWIAQGTAADSPMTVDAISFLVMRAFKIKGGLMYTIFKNHRYALRELMARNVVNGSGGKKRIVSGEEAVGIIGKTAALGAKQKESLQGGVQ